ncbi:MAG: TIGR02302 family protein [Alphaproteobacteria bacterium]|nr:TIGR02302 family protein [Alphaproteobacteria bacterium]
MSDWRDEQTGDTPRIGLSRLALFWESAWPALWPATGIAGLFLLIALLDILPDFSGWLHAAILAAFAIALATALYRGVRALRLPDRASAQRRLERINNLPHRPFEALDDQMATPDGDEATQRLWQLHRERMARRLKNLRVGWPKPGLSRHDKLALRVAVLPLLAVMAIAVGSDGTTRITRAVTPNLSGQDSAETATLDAWITPPAYTGKPPLFLTRAETEVPSSLEVPTGSILLAQVGGTGAAPQLAEGEVTEDFTTVADDSYRVERSLTADAKLRILSNGRELKAWNITVVPDDIPRVALDEPPSPSKRGALRLVYTASDDYGLVSITATIKRSDVTAKESISYEIPLSGANLKQAKGDNFRDLTPHPWAGLPVHLTLVATDAAGQRGESDTVSFRLPERPFAHPVAQEIVAARKRLMADPANNRLGVVDDLGSIALKPKRYADDKVVFMALYTATRRLRQTAFESELDEVQKLLWETALRIEDGTVSLAERDLRRAQQELLEALARNAPESELDRLMDQLQAALSAYLDALTQQAANAGQNNQEMGKIDPSAQMLTKQDLQRMMEEIRELAKSGAREAARKMLSQMQKMLENLQAGRGQPQPQAGQAQQMMNDLQRVTRGQRDLLDRTFRESQRETREREGTAPDGPENGGKPQKGDQAGSQPMAGEGQQRGSLTAGAVAQDALRRQLGDIMQRFAEMTGDVPGPMGRAEQSMRKSSKNLRKGSAKSAVPPQTRALDQLQQAMRSAQQQLQQRFGQQPGQGQVRGPGQKPDDRDPFGRTMNSGIQGANTNTIEIPEKSDLQRSREIRDELRRRAADPARPKPERDYIDRLLDRF